MLKNILFIFLLGFLFSSCDECNNLDCENSSDCENGKCICDKGWEGTTCKTRANHKYLGAYNGTQNCDGASKNLELSHLTSGIEPWQVKIIFNGTSIDADVEATTMTITDQYAKFNGDSVHILSTSGRLTGNSLVFSVHYQNGSNEDKTCVYNFIRK